MRRPVPHPRNAHSFEGSAEHYDRMARRFMRRPLRRIAADAVAGLPPGASVLDVGTGPGWLLVEIARRRPDVRLTGLDLAPDMVDAAGRNLAGLGERAQAVCGDVTALPFPDASIDLIVSTLSLHHWAEPAAGGAELARVRRPGGQIRIYDVRRAPFAAFQSGVIGRDAPVSATRVRITPLPRPTLRLLVL